MNDRPLTVTVYGSPVPQGSKRYVGNGRMIEASKHLPMWRNTIVDMCRWQMEQRMPLEGPVALRAHFTVAKPMSAPKRRRTWPSKKPDIDKLLRAVMDAITAAGVWRDDAQVIDARATKSYPNETETALDVPGVRFTVVPLETE